MAEPAALAEAFARIARTRMAGMALCNPALAVEAVGFRAVAAGHVGVLVTPWAINLVLLPGPGLPALGPGASARHEFPSGGYEFMGGDEPECGPFRFCPLASPPEGLASQAEARELATAVMAQLFAPRGALPRRALFVPGAAAAT